MSRSERDEALLAGWGKKGVVSLTVRDIARREGASARDTASRLVEAGKLRRVDRGLYVLGKKTDPKRALAAFLSKRRRAYLGGDWALWLHDHLDVMPRRADIFVPGRLRPRKLAGYPVRFTALPARSFDYGLVTLSVDGIDLRISNLERTILDALDHPRLSKDFEDDLLLVAENVRLVDELQIVEYALRGSTTPTCQRLGALLEAMKTSDRILEPLADRVAGATSSLSMLPSRPRRGRWYERWQVIDNRPGVTPRER